MQKRMLAGRASAIAITAALNLTAPPWAAAAEADASNATIEEVIVTAQRREESLQEVPVSVSAVTAETLANANLTNSQELEAIVPGLVMTRVNGNSQTYIRGVGTQAILLGTEASVGYYLDGVYLASTTGTVFGLNNIERVEVLRGPQGTLFGRNATAGVIQIVTKKPQQDPELKVGLSYGSYQTSTASLYATGGLADGVAASLALFSEYQGKGYGVNNVTGQEINYNREFGGRAQVYVNPTEALSVLLSADYDQARNDLSTNRQLYPGSRSTSGTTRVGGPHDGNYSFGVFAKNRVWGVSADARAQLGPGELRSITAYRRFSWYNIYDQDATPARVVDVTRNEDAETFQQELLYSGGVDRFDWTVGAIYFRLVATQHPGAIQSVAGSATNIARFAVQTTNSYAAFGQGSFDVTDSLRLTGGVRYTADRIDIQGSVVTLPGHPLGPNVTTVNVTGRELSSNKLTWRFGADYKVSDDVMIYGVASRGYKSGQFNVNTVTQAPTRPEVLDALEAGFKSDLLDNRLRFNVSAFHYSYEDIQLSTVQPPPIGQVTLNAASARVRGAEIEVRAVPPVAVGHLEVGASVALLHGKYRDFPNAPIAIPQPFASPPAGVTCPTASSTAAGGNASCRFDASGQRMIRSPKWTLNLNAEYTAQIGPGDLTLSANYFHSDGFYWEPANRIKQPAYDVLNAQIAFSPTDSPLRVRAFVRNLTDELYYSSVSEQSVGDLATAAPPRTFGVGIDYRW